MTSINGARQSSFRQKYVPLNNTFRNVQSYATSMHVTFLSTTESLGMFNVELKLKSNCVQILKARTRKNTVTQM